MPSPQPHRIALFGGSFDPVHAGHLAIADAAVQESALDRVIFLPAAQSPHKIDRPSAASAADRLAMLRLATADRGWADVSDWELGRPPPSWSWHAVAHFRQQFPESELYWLLGADQWATLPDWANAEYLRENLIFLIFPRPPAPQPKPREGWRSQHLTTQHLANSTAIRAALKAADASAWQHFLPPSVATYIENNALYQSRPDAL